VMEYLRGHDLEQVLPGGDAEHIAGIGRDVCSGLAYAHREGVIHRDIKPANLFHCESGQVKITDFGVARAADGTTLSTIGVVVGTLAFLPPERWRGEPPAFSNDIWAVGCVLYRLISGRLPRVLPDVADYAAAATRGDPFPDLRDITDAPGWLTGPVMAMLADDPASRPAAGECVQLLSSAQFPPPAPGQPVRSRHLPGLLGFGLPGSGQAGPALAAGAGGGDPVTSPVTRADASRPTARRPRRAGRGALAVAGLLVLLLAGSVTAWRLSDTPSGRELAASSAATTTAAAGQVPAATPVATSRSGSRSSSAAAAPRHSTAAVAPATPPSVTRASSRPASPAASAAAPPSGSPTASPTASPSASPPASSAPPLVPVPDVVGMTFTEARLLLVSDGFTVVGKHTRAGQIVARTKPLAGEVPAGSLITVVYGTGKLLLRGRGPRCPRPLPRPERQRLAVSVSPSLSSPFWIAAPALMIRIPNLPEPT
jgi:serine/threonine protein kinase